MEQFTLEAAQKGQPLITRDGRPARYVAFMQKSNEQFPVVFEVFAYTPDELEEEFRALKKEEDELLTHWPKTDWVKFEKQRLNESCNWKTENYSIDGEFLPPFPDEKDLFLSDNYDTSGPVCKNENQLQFFK